MREVDDSAMRQAVSALALLLVALMLGRSVALAAPESGMNYPSIWHCDDAKFNWYCDEEPEPGEGSVTKPQTAEDTALEELERIRKDLKAKRALAILTPTSENVRSYIATQEIQMERASRFSDVWRRVIWADPELNYGLRNPVNDSGIKVHDSERKKDETNTMAEIVKDWGLFFFFRSDCPYCHRLAPTLKMLTDRYGITVFPISVDGGTLPDYPNSARDNGMSRLVNANQVPFIALANIKDRRLIPLASGIVAASDIVERIYVLTQTQPGELY